MALAIPNELERLRDGAKRFLGEFTLGQKTVVGVAFVAVVVASVAYLHYASQPTYAPLYTQLTTSDAAAVTQKLQSQHIPYQLTDNGTTVEVPQNAVYQQRITLAESGLPNQTKNVGLSKVDSEGITTSSFQQTVDFQQGLQGELQSTIEAISGVQAAQVNLVLPNDNPLALNNSPNPSAAVMVTMQPSKSLGDDQVQAIVHLVASSVPGLSASDVTVTDSTGALLAGPGANPHSFSSQDKQTKLYDNGVAQDIQRLVEPLVGPNNSVVVVNANLNFDQTSQVIKGLETNPDGTVQQAANQSNCQNQSFTGTTLAPGGVAGSLLPPAASSGTGTFTQSGCQQNFTIGQFTKNIQTAPGAITSESVAVVVNSNALSKAVKASQIEQLVDSAAAIDVARGDQVTVSPLPFSNAVAKAQQQASAAAAAQARHNDIMTGIRVAAVALAILILLLLIHRSARKPEEILPEELPALEAGEPAEEDLFPREGEELTMGEEAAMEAAGENPFDLDLTEGIPHELETSSIGEFIENQPDEVARLLRAWMQDAKIPGMPPKQAEQQPV